MKTIENIDSGDISVNYESITPSEDSATFVLCHDKCEIIYITSGDGKYVSEGKNFKISPRSLFISRPFEYRSISLSEGELFSRYIIRFSESSLSDDAKDMFEQMISDEGSTYYSPGSALSLVESCFDRLYIAEKLPYPKRRAFLEALISEMIVLLSMGTRDGIQSAEDTLSNRVSRYINSNLNRDLSLDDLSKRFFVNKYYLCRTFKSQSGTSIHSYINRKRVLYAKQLIESGETASQAAYLVGFGDYSAFYRAYMKIYGRSPTSSEK